MNYTFHKLRGGGTITISGLSGSISFGETHSNSSGENGILVDANDYETVTFSIPALGTPSSTSYTDPTATLNFGGTAFAGTPGTTNIKISLAGQQLSSATASGLTLSNYLTDIVNGFVFTGAATGYSAVSTGTTIVFTGPLGTGNADNGVSVTTIVSGTTSQTFTASTGASFSAGYDIYPIVLTYSPLGGGTTYTYTV
jgi:hypothetical protein